MNRSDTERLTDELIGEATLSLLKENGPISIKNLLERLHSMLSVERSGERRKALAEIILEISNEHAGAQPRTTKSEEQAWDKDSRSNSNVYSLFGNGQQTRSSKKH